MSTDTNYGYKYQTFEDGVTVLTAEALNKIQDIILVYDAAIGGIVTDRIKTVNVSDTTTSKAVASVSVNLSSTSLLNFWSLELMLDAPGYTGNVEILINDLTSGYVKLAEDSADSSTQSSLVTLTAPAAQPFRLEFPHVVEGGWVGVHGYQQHYEADGSCWVERLDAVAPVAWEDLTKIKIKAASGSFPVGTRITLRGQKK